MIDEDETTPTHPPPSMRPHADEVGAKVLDDAMRKTGSHKAQELHNVAMTHDIGDLTKAIRYYAKTQLVGFLMLTLVVAAMAWRAWVFSDLMSMRFRLTDEKWQHLYERLDRAGVKP